MSEKNSGREEISRDEASMDGRELADLATRLKEILDVRDRRYGLPPKKYPRCFVGNEAVGQMISAGFATDEADAVRIGNLMLNMDVFHHVQYAHEFKNEYLFYRFTEDEDHGAAMRKPDGKPVNWADFITPVASKGDVAFDLQPTLPEKDQNLAALAQDDLDSIGIAPLDEHNAELLNHVYPKRWNDPKPKPKYNLVVIGAGAGGLVSAAAASGVGARTALIESHLLGGDCLNVGCVPSKALLRCAKAAAAVRGAGRFGVNIDGAVKVDFPFVMQRMRRLRAQIAPVDSARRYSEKLGVDVFLGKGRFIGSNQVEVNGQTLNFAKAVIATGGTAAIPGIPGLSQAPYLTNATVFNLTDLPARLGVIGAGPIGLELAQAFRRFGSRVTVFSRSDKILPKEDPQAAALVRAALEKDGVRFAFHSRYKGIESDGGNPPIRMHMEDSDGAKTLEFDALLVAAGRKPAVKRLGLAEAGVEFDERSGIAVDDRLQTSNSDVFAVGDVASKYQFTHMADFMARLVIRNALFFGKDKVSDLLVPWVTYTDPEVAHVGLYERDLTERGVEFQTIRRDFAEVDRSIVDGETEGFVKIHLKKGSDRILGATIVGSHAGDMISEITVAMQSGMGLGKLANVIHPYPTTAEAIRQCGDAYNRTRLTPTVKSIFYRLMSLRR